MKQRIWVILGATSIIAERFAHLAAKDGHQIRLVGRDQEQLAIIAQDITLRHKVFCEIILLDMMDSEDQLVTALEPSEQELDLFIAYSDFTDNKDLNATTINQLIKTNIFATTILIDAYLKLEQKQHNLCYISSVAACRGRAKNSLYGASKAAIEIYLQGLQQGSSKNQQITIARLGFIDTKQTYGQPGIFYAAQPEDCAKACWKAMKHKKNMFYYPSFWKLIMALIKGLPFFIYKRLGLISK